MAEEKKESIDLKNLTPQDLVGMLKSVFGKDSQLLSDKTLVFIVCAFLTSFILAFFIYSQADNQNLYDIQQSRYNKASTELSALTSKFDATIKANKGYFTQLFTSPKTVNELSAKITKLLSNYNLKLLNIDLQKKVDKTKVPGIGLEVSGTYMNLFKFSKELNKYVAASQIIDVSVTKKKKDSNLVLKMAIKFAPPPNPNSIPSLKPATVSLNLDNIHATLHSSLLNKVLGSLIGAAYANETTTLSPFQEAYLSARKQGLYDFEFTNKEGRTLIFKTGIPKQATSEPSKEKKMTDFQIALSDAKRLGQHEFKFTIKSGETKIYATGLTKTTVAKLPEIDAVNNSYDIPPLQFEAASEPSKEKKMTDFQIALSDAKRQGLHEFKFTIKSGETKIYATGLTKTTVAKLPEIDAVNGYELPPLVNTDPIIEQNKPYSVPAPITARIIVDNDFEKNDLKLAGFVESDPFGESQPNTDPVREPELEPELEAEQDTFRDPFAEPIARKAVKRKSTSTDAESEQYYLSGIMISDEMDLCIILTPEGEFLIYGIGDKISDDIVLTGIAFRSIQISKLNKEKVIGFGEQVN